MTTKAQPIKFFSLILATVFAALFAAMPLVACSTDSAAAPPVMCTVTFITGEGSSTVPAQTVERGSYLIKPEDPTRDGYKFDAWYKDSAYGEKWNFDSDKVLQRGVKLYAKWTLSTEQDPTPPSTTYSVTFDVNGGHWTNGSTASISVTTDTAGKIAESKWPENPERTGYAFKGWYVSANGTGAVYTYNSAFKANTTLKAGWTKDESDPKPSTTYTVTFEVNGGHWTNGSTANKSVATDTAGKISSAKWPENPERTGYTFKGWYVSANGTGTAYTYSSTFKANTTLKAGWTKIEDEPKPTYTVTFEVNGGHWTNGSTANKSVTTDTSGKISSAKWPANPERSGYTFKGWYVSANGTGTAYTYSSTFKANTTLKAGWTKIETEPDPTGTVTATFNVGLEARKSGCSNPPAQTVTYGSKIVAPDVTRDGFTINGWYAEEGSNKWDFSSGTLTKNTTFFAKWNVDSSSTRPSYTPSSDLNGNNVYIHYYRFNSDYDNYTVYAWNGSTNKTYSVHTIDASGAVFKIPYAELGYTSITGSTQLNFIVTLPGWIKDGGDNVVGFSEMAQYSATGNAYHWYVVEGSTASGSNSFVGGGSSSGGTLRASRSNVNRSYAANLPLAGTATTCDDMGVGYQIFVASFCDSNGDGVGDIRGIISKLDYLDSLNVDVLWLTPIQSSDSLHGYDCYDYYYIDPKFGTNADYRELVTKAHARGIKVIMDLVVNHTSTSNEWFLKSKRGVVETVTYQDGTTATVDYRDFYRWSNTKSSSRYYSTGDGWYYYSSFNSSMPELNYDCQQVRDAMADVAMYWMAYGLDGFRMDAIKHVFMWDESTNASGDASAGDSGYVYNLTKNVEFFKEFNYKLKTKYPYCFLLGEQLDGNAANVAPFYAGMDSLFDFNTYFDLPRRINDGNTGTLSNMFNNNAANYTRYRGDRPINSMISSNHDISRLSDALSANTAKIKLYFAVMLTMPGLSWIYYGDELGMKNNGSGDNAYRQSVRWTDSWDNKCTCIGYGGTNANIASVDAQSSDSGSMLYYVRLLTSLRNAHPALINGTAQCASQDGMLKITVKNSSETLVIYHNFTSGSKSPSQSGTRVFGSASIAAYGTAVYVTA